ncbi:replication initiator protein A [Weissella muntiaci]|uniref:Replication initiator protein A n=1 Tax=Weissella muntiaci TaxID=2508881 RepID=A0A6C2C1W7_9LACO|nr:replication initiator protein A [Weissella muntiaci]TYC47988.1 replication initiator protein A [Weissella muntiaci]
MERININQVLTSERFYQVPKALFELSYYKPMSLSSKMAYGILKDRFQLSLSNKWIDENGHVYFIFTIKNLQDILDMGKTKVIQVKKELAEYGLLVEVRQGMNKPNRLYIGSIQEVIHRDEPSDSKEVQNVNLRKFRKRTSGSSENGRPEVQNMNPNDTDVNETDYKDTEIISFLDDDQISQTTRVQMASEEQVIADELQKDMGIDYSKLNTAQKKQLLEWVSKTELSTVLAAINKSGLAGGKTVGYVVSTVQTIENENQEKMRAAAERY